MYLPKKKNYTTTTTTTIRDWKFGSLAAAAGWSVIPAAQPAGSTQQTNPVFHCRLVGFLHPVGDGTTFMNAFHGLVTECTAQNARFLAKTTNNASVFRVKVPLACSLNCQCAGSVELGSTDLNSQLPKSLKMGTKNEEVKRGGTSTTQVVPCWASPCMWFLHCSTVFWII